MECIEDKELIAELEFDKNKYKMNVPPLVDGNQRLEVRDEEHFMSV